MFYHTILDYLMATGKLIDENIKSLCCLVWTFETRITITIMTDQYQHCEDITMFNIIEIIAQLACINRKIVLHGYNVLTVN